MLRNPQLFKTIFSIASHDAYGADADKGGVNVHGPEWIYWVKHQSPTWLTDANIAAKTGKTWPNLRTFAHTFAKLYDRDTDRTKGPICKFFFFTVILSDTPMIMPPVYLAYETITQDDIDFIQQKVGMMLIPVADNLMKVQWLTKDLCEAGRSGTNVGDLLAQQSGVVTKFGQGDDKMKVIEPGHVYSLDMIKGDGSRDQLVINFVRRTGDGGKITGQGVTTKEVVRVLIDRMQFLQKKGGYLNEDGQHRSAVALQKLEEVLMWLEYRTMANPPRKWSD